MIAPNGGHPVRLTETKLNELQPAVSPTGDRSPSFGDDGGISTMKLDGSGKRIATRGGDFEPNWSPDARTPYFSRSGRQGRWPAAWIFSVSSERGAVH